MAGTGSNSPRGTQLDTSGEINILEQLLGLLGPLLSSAGMSPDKYLLNTLTGSPFAGQQARIGGRSPSLFDVMDLTQQRDFFKFSQDTLRQHKQNIIQGAFGFAGFNNAETRAQNATNNFYNPVGLAADVAMLTYGAAGASQAYSQGFMGMNIYAPRAGARMTMGQKQDREMMSNFVEQMQSDYFADPGAYGGFNLQGQGEVFQQMAQRSLLGRGDIENRSKATSMRVQEMSQAVGAMQELFGGTIPELFDKMDAIFGGNAGAMGGQQLQQRILRMKQTSAVTGQSLAALAQMNMMGGQYAEMMGMDAGIGARAAGQTGLAMGVNYRDGGFNTRRIRAGRLRESMLASNVSAATSRMTQLYAGAQAVFVRQNGGSPEALARFRKKAAGATTIEELAAASGGSVADVQQMSMGDQAAGYMSDDKNVAAYGIALQHREEQQAIASALAYEVSERTGRQVDPGSFLKGGFSTARMKDILRSKYNLKNADAIVEATMNQAGATFREKQLNGQELEAAYFMQANKGELERLTDLRARDDAFLGKKLGGGVGVLGYLARRKDKGGEEDTTARLGEVISAAFGITTPAEAKAKIAATQLRDMYAEAEGNEVKRGKIRTVLKSLASGDVLMKLSPEKREAIRKKLMDGDITEADLTDVWKEVATDDQRLAAKTLKEVGLDDDFAAAFNAGKMKEANAYSRRAAVAGALRGITGDKVKESIRKALSDGKGNIVLEGAREKLKDIQWQGNDKDKFFTDMERRANALGVADPKISMQDIPDILKKLTEVLERYANARGMK